MVVQVQKDFRLILNHHPVRSIKGSFAIFLLMSRPPLLARRACRGPPSMSLPHRVRPLFPYMLESRAMLSAGIGWTRTVVYGLTAEIAVIPLFGLTYWALGAKPAQYSTMPFSFLVVFVFAYMTASTRTSRPVLQGFLVGVVAFASYFAIGFIGRLVMMLCRCHSNGTGRSG